MLDRAAPSEAVTPHAQPGGRCGWWRTSGLAIWPLLLVLTTGCAWRSYQPAPLDLAAAAASDADRRLVDDTTRAALEAAGVDTSAWPDLLWTRDTLLPPLLAVHPEQRAARARVVAAAAKVPAVMQPTNPELSSRLENHSDAGDSSSSPWAIGAALQFTLNTMPLRTAQGAVASAELDDARLAAGESAWRLYRALGDALLERQLAADREHLAERNLELAQARNESMAIRQRYGAASALEVQIAAERLLAARREQADAQAASTTAQARLAAALALPPSALAGVRFAAWPAGSVPDAAAARAAALQNRLDLARELARYAVAEADVRVEVAKQYPQIRIGPGMVWEQGDRVWQLAFGLPLALLHRNRAAIDAAEARRSAQGEQVLARQSAIVAEVETLRQQADALQMPLQVALAAADAAAQRTALVQAQFDAGSADALALIDARSLQLQAERSAADARAVLWRAQWALEAALQSPLTAR